MAIEHQSESAGYSESQSTAGRAASEAIEMNLKEKKHVRQLQKQGWTADKIKSWLRGWRLVGKKLQTRKSI